VIKITSALLTDKSPIVRHSAAGALRNMSTIGSSICSNMISHGLMPHLVTLFKENYSKDWRPQSQCVPQPANGFKIDTNMETFIEAVNLLWNLCESTRNAVIAFNEEGLAQFLTPCLNQKEYGIRVATAAGQCLNTVTEDNRDAIPNHEEVETLLQKILVTENDTSVPKHPTKTDWVYLQTLASGILLNLGKQPPATISLVMKTISEMLSIDHIQPLKAFTSDLPLPNGTNLMDTNGETGRPATTCDTIVEEIHSLEVKAVNIGNLFCGHILALEILSNILFDENDEDDDEDYDPENDSDEDVMAMDAEMMEEDDEMKDESSWTNMIPEVYEAIVNNHILDKVMDKVREPPVNVEQILKECPEYGRNLVNSILHLRSRALLCFQNLVLNLDLNDLGGFAKVKEIWVSLNQLLKQEAVNSEIQTELVEATTSAVRAIVQKLVDEKEQKLDMVGSVSIADFNVLCDLYSKVDIAKIHTNIIKITGGMGILIAKDAKEGLTKTAIEDLLEQVGSFLLSRISNYGDSQHLWRVSESLDTIFDVFAEDDYNHVLEKLGMIEKLKVFLPQFKKNIRNQRRNLGENKAIIETSRTNLARFIEYKVQNGCA